MAMTSATMSRSVMRTRLVCMLQHTRGHEMTHGRGNTARAFPGTFLRAAAFPVAQSPWRTIPRAGNFTEGARSRGALPLSPVRHVASPRPLSLTAPGERPPGAWRYSSHLALVLAGGGARGAY